MVDRVASAYIRPYSTHRINGTADEKTRDETEIDADFLRANHEDLVATEQEKSHPKTYWTRKEHKVFGLRFDSPSYEMETEKSLF